MVTLKPCPFCGGEAAFGSSEYGFTAYLRVFCKACGARSAQLTYSFRENDLDENKDCIPPEKRKVEIAQFWNLRRDSETLKGQQ